MPRLGGPKVVGSFSAFAIPSNHFRIILQAFLFKISKSIAFWTSLPFYENCFFVRSLSVFDVSDAFVLFNFSIGKNFSIFEKKEKKGSKSGETKKNKKMQ